LTRILFRGGSIEDAISYLTSMINFETVSASVSMIGIGALLLATILHYTPDRWTIEWKALFIRMPSFLQAGFIVFTVFALIAMSSGEAPFVYFQF
jgi:hypothetical protein